MRVATGKVVDGKVIVEAEPLDEGTVVTVLSREGVEIFELTSDQEAQLLLAIGEAERGETIPARKLLDQLQRHN